MGRVGKGKVGLEEDKGCNWIDRTVTGSSRTVAVLMLQEKLRGRGDRGHHRASDGKSVRNLWYTFSGAGGDTKKGAYKRCALPNFLPSFGQISPEL